MDFANRKLLTIDDEAAIRRSIKIFFEDSGFNVLEAENGEKGLEICRMEKPDIVLVDLRMPGMGGLEVIKIMAEQMPDIPVIVVSGTGVLEDALEAIRAGADDYITKPVKDMQILEHVIMKTMEKAELKRENRLYQEHLEELVEKRTQELRHAQKMEALGTLAGGIAHDFNNILTSITGYTELSIINCKDENVAGFLQNIKQASNRATELVKQILTFCRKGEHERKPVNIAVLLKEAIRFLRSSIPSNVTIRHTINSDSCVLGDPSQIHQIIMNLCTNAYHAMEDGGGTLSILLEDIKLTHKTTLANVTLSPGRYVKLEVADTGCGMDMDIQQRIFDPYFTTKGSGKGSGMGLSVVHGIVGSCNGAISVFSEPGKGSRFTVFLPVVEDRKTEAMSAGEIVDVEGSETVLFVDDEEQIVDVVRRGLSGLGYHVEAFTEPHAALDAFRTSAERFDIAVMDIMMPGMDGYALARELLKIREDIPVILCTGFFDKVEELRVQDRRIREYMTKPFKIKTLAQTIRSNLDR